MALYTTISAALNQKNGELCHFGPLTSMVSWLMFTHPNSTLHVQCMLMYLSSGQVTFYEGNCKSLNFYH